MKSTNYDIDISTKKLLQRGRKCLYYNKYCWFILKGDEIYSINKLLFALYEYHVNIKEKNSDLKDTHGITFTDIQNKTGLSPLVISRWVLAFCPFYIYMNMVDRARFVCLNKKGVKLARSWISQWDERCINKLQQKS